MFIYFHISEQCPSTILVNPRSLPSVARSLSWKAPMRVVQVDLDYVYDPDPEQEAESRRFDRPRLSVEDQYGFCRHSLIPRLRAWRRRCSLAKQRQAGVAQARQCRSRPRTLPPRTCMAVKWARSRQRPAAQTRRCWHGGRSIGPGTYVFSTCIIKEKHYRQSPAP